MYLQHGEWNNGTNHELQYFDELTVAMEDIEMAETARGKSGQMNFSGCSALRMRKRKKGKEREKRLTNDRGKVRVIIFERMVA